MTVLNHIGEPALADRIAKQYGKYICEGVVLH